MPVGFSEDSSMHCSPVGGVSVSASSMLQCMWHGVQCEVNPYRCFFEGGVSCV